MQENAGPDADGVVPGSGLKLTQYYFSIRDIHLLLRTIVVAYNHFGTAIAIMGIKRVAVIGLGPAGAITIDALAREKVFDTIRVFERREAAGGCW
jgi:hypothetical protein